MTQAFQLHDRGHADLIAASHPYDATIRPQLVRKSANPGYHHLITKFEELTGRGGILNTSFNLHGEPIVYSPADAIDVFIRSELEYLAFDNFILSKNPT